MSEVASFYFTRLPDSYAARTDRPDHVGVIGVAVFREWQQPAQVLRDAPANARERSSLEANADAAGAPGAAARQEAKRAEKIGTGHGERERSEVVYTQFRRAGSTPNETIAIHYDTAANLVAQGVITRTPRVVTPNPFPGERFTPDPRG
jgi:hypothetical protein